MSNSESQTIPFTYRQRLTTVGNWGVALALFAPLVASYFIMEYLSYSAEAAYYKASSVEILAREPEGKATTNGIIALLFSLGSVVGWIMILIGREYYPFKSDKN